MSPRRVLIYGNSGSGKTTMARRLAADLAVPHLDLDSITWDSPAARKALPATLSLLQRFLDEHRAWVIEGCYGDVIEAATVHCTELRFLAPGVEACVAHCRLRPFEPTKHPSKEAQDAMLEALIDWVRQYETRSDEYGLARHRAVFDAFPGPKREYLASDLST